MAGRHEICPYALHSASPLKINGYIVFITDNDHNEYHCVGANLVFAGIAGNEYVTQCDMVVNP
jgi:hypothetical protein